MGVLAQCRLAVVAGRACGVRSASARSASAGVGEVANAPNTVRARAERAEVAVNAPRSPRGRDRPRPNPVWPNPLLANPVRPDPVRPDPVRSSPTRVNSWAARGPVRITTGHPRWWKR
ncbi:hypothetical protein LX83_004212 [Goodfellowiella coeruleoviolacea]|uniref:Uncharacterized protein n=1 Tax=Goodfellowiella coeruleoviolacea TaxID=334858 RepID=A0AAE3GHE9_9PSEU|nr:hypothetical protein [Goodfellowiella coeruleoviolacea]